MKRILGVGIAFAMVFGMSPVPAQAAGSGLTKARCVAINREWLTVKRDLAGIDMLYKISEVAAALQHASTVWSASATTVRAKGGTKVATALTTAATSASALRVKLIKSDTKGALALSDTMSAALEKTVLPACAPLV